MSSAGWHVANIDLDDFTMRIACVELQVVIVLVGYRYMLTARLNFNSVSQFGLLAACRLAPENPFPTSVNDSYAGLKWVCVDPSPSEHPVLAH